ncbi:MAG: stage II sporulation protein R [Clostridia bacterium]|nr:stage II sporulation protein R [Clostridia bacterium]
MKKLVILLLVVLCVALVALPQPTNQDFLRIHIRADSNNDVDQAIKFVVRDAIVQYLSPLLVGATTKQKAMEILASQLQNIQHVCDKVLLSNGFAYTSTVSLCAETFPDRSYNGINLPSGVYDALIVNLGSGSGNNWWCVVYPPLCFVGGQPNGSNQVQYKSKLWEIVQQWLSNR